MIVLLYIFITEIPTTVLYSKIRVLLQMIMMMDVHHWVPKSYSLSTRQSRIQHSTVRVGRPTMRKRLLEGLSVCSIVHLSAFASYTFFFSAVKRSATRVMMLTTVPTMRKFSNYGDAMLLKLLLVDNGV